MSLDCELVRALKKSRGWKTLGMNRNGPRQGTVSKKVVQYTNRKVPDDVSSRFES